MSADIEVLTTSPNYVTFNTISKEPYQIVTTHTWCSRLWGYCKTRETIGKWNTTLLFAADEWERWNTHSCRHFR